MKLIIEIDDDIAKGIRGENDCNVEPREIVRSFQATISEAIANGKPYEERPQGEWKYYKAEDIFLPYMECTNCKFTETIEDTTPRKFRKWNKYCNLCGAKMFKEKEKKK